MFAILKSKYIRCLIGIFVFIFVSFVTYSSYASVCFLPTGDCGGDDVSADTNEDLPFWCEEDDTDPRCKNNSDGSIGCTGSNCNNSDDTETKCTNPCTTETGHRTCTTDSNGCSIVEKECSGNTYLTQAYCTSANSGKTCTQSGSCWVVESISTPVDTCVASDGLYETEDECLSENAGKTCTQSGSCWVVNSTSCPTGYSLSCDKTKYTCALHTENSTCKKLECNTANAYYGTYDDCTHDTEMDCYLDNNTNCYVPSECDITVAEYLNEERCEDISQMVCVLNSFNCYEPYRCSESNREFSDQHTCEEKYQENIMGCEYISSNGCYRPLCDAGEERFFDQRTCEEEYQAVCNLNNGCYEPYICSSENREYTSQTSCKNAYSENYMGCAYASSVGCYRPICDAGDGLVFDLAECEEYWDSCVLDTTSGCYKQKIGDNCDETKSLYDDERVCEETWQSTCKVVDGCYKPTRFYIDYIGVDYDCRSIRHCDVNTQGGGMGIECDDRYGCYGETIIYPKDSDDISGDGMSCSEHQCNYPNHSLGFPEGTYIINTSGYRGPTLSWIGSGSTRQRQATVVYYEAIKIFDDLGNEYDILPQNQDPDPVWNRQKAKFQKSICGLTEFTYYNGEGEFTFEGGRIYSIYPQEGNIKSNCTIN